MITCLSGRNRLLRLAIILLAPFVSSNVFCQSITFNEILASNASLDYDDFFQYEDWIELYNSGSIQDLAGYHLSDDPDSLDKWMFPVDDPGLTTILPNGHIRVWCDKDDNQGTDHTNFKLSGDGETVYLVAQDGITILDSRTFGIQQDDISFGAQCDGCTDWQYFNVPTPDATNTETALSPSVLFINEIQTNNSSTIFDEEDEPDAWVELFNPNDFQVNLASYSLELNGTSHTFENYEPWLITIPANGFQIFWLDGQTEQGSNHLAILPTESGTLFLKANNGMTIDEANLSPSFADESWGRQQDGSPTWMIFAAPTPRVTNTLQVVEPGTLVINEVQADNFITFPDNYGEYDDWIEIYNFGNAPVDIANYYLSDRPDQPQKWLIPTCNCDSTVIQPNSFVVLYADEDGSQGWNHANFKVSSNGETIALRSPDGYSLADEVDVPFLSLGKSWGRLTDAGSPWIEFNIPTPDASNGQANAIIEQEFKKTPYPNPVQKGQIMTVSSAGTLLDLTGKALLKWQAPTSFTITLPMGMYIIQWEGGSPYEATPSKIIVTE